MSWTTPGAPAHIGFLVGLVARDDLRRRMGDDYRELTIADNAAVAGGLYLTVLQVGCVCGWRSSRMEAPIGACWWPGKLDAPAWFEEHCQSTWRAHAIATAFAVQERDRMTRIADADR